MALNGLERSAALGEVGNLLYADGTPKGLTSQSTGLAGVFSELSRLKQSFVQTPEQREQAQVKRRVQSLDREMGRLLGALTAPQCAAPEAAIGMLGKVLGDITALACYLGDDANEVVSVALRQRIGALNPGDLLALQIGLLDEINQPDSAWLKRLGSRGKQGQQLLEQIQIATSVNDKAIALPVLLVQEPMQALCDELKKGESADDVTLERAMEHFRINVASLKPQSQSLPTSWRPHSKRCRKRISKDCSNTRSVQLNCVKKVLRLPRTANTYPPKRKPGWRRGWRCAACSTIGL